ncbi:MAG: hypothetical protein ACLPV8_25425 [Steroidobacteraceae bacterium]
MSTGSAHATERPELRYRPATAEGRAPAILQLYRAGLRVRDISAAVGVPLTEVLEAVRAAQASG